MFKDFLTAEGERLLARSIAGTATITFTKMEIGDGDSATITNAITSLINPKMALDIYSVLLTGDNNIQITTMLESSAMQSGFYFREKGLYATDGTTEILFMYGNSGSLAEWMEHVDNAIFTRTIRTVITLAESDNAKITFQKGAYASSEDAENILTAINNIKLDGDWAKYSQAESILSLLDTFVAAYTTLRAGKLDNLDAPVSSRAPANTALSNAVWTNGRAGAIDNLDAKISSRAQASTALSNGVWTDARAGYLDNLPTILSYAYSAMANIGSTADGGGGVNTGNVMAKLNTLLGKGSGDYSGRAMSFRSTRLAVTVMGTYEVLAIDGRGVFEWTLANTKSDNVNDVNPIITVVIDGVAVASGLPLSDIIPMTYSGDSNRSQHYMVSPIKIPFNSSLRISYTMNTLGANGATLLLGGILYT